MDAAKIQDKLKKKFGSAQRTGGKGTARQKQRNRGKKTGRQDDKRLQQSLKKINCNSIPGIEEVNLFKQDGTVIHFENPTVQAAISANTYAVSGHCDTKSIQELLPGILQHMGTENLEQLKQLAGSLGKISEDNEDGANESGSDEDSDDIPDLVDGNFEDAANVD
eukprot:101360_1